MYEIILVICVFMFGKLYFSLVSFQIENKFLQPEFVVFLQTSPAFLNKKFQLRIIQTPRFEHSAHISNKIILVYI